MQETIIAKKYARALASASDMEEIKNTYSIYSQIQSAFMLSKFSTIINSHIISKENKLEFIRTLIESLKQKLDSKSEKLLLLLAENNRLALIPFIAAELKKIIDFKQNIYLAILHTKENISQNILDRIKSNLGKKLGVTLDIIQEIDLSIEGIRLDIPDLCIEVVFLKDKFTRELQDFILKAI